MSLLQSCSHYLQSRLPTHPGGATFGLLGCVGVGGSFPTNQHCNNVTLNRQLHQPSLSLSSSSWKVMGANSLSGRRFVGTHYYAAESISLCRPHEDVNKRLHSLFFAQPSASKVQLQLQSCRYSSTTSSTSQNDRNKNQPKRVFINMKKQPTIEAVADVTFKQLNLLQPANLAAFWNRVSQLMTQRQDRKRTPKNQSFDPDQQEKLEGQLNAIFHKTMGDMKKFGPKDLAQTAVGVAKISIQLESNRGRRSTELSYPILSDLVIGIKSQQKDMIFQTIANVSIRKLSKFDARYLANLAHANAKVVLNPVVGDGGGTLFDHIAEKSVPKLNKFKPQHLANTVWSFEKVGAHNPKLFEAVAEAVCSMKDLGQFKPQELSNILLAYVKAGQPNQILFKKIADHIVENCNLHSFDSQALANTVWAYATAGESNPALFKRVADHIIDNCNLQEFQPQALSNILMAYVKAGQSNPALFKKVADHIIALDSLHSFAPQNLANSVWAYATAGESNPALFKKVADHIIALDSLHSFAPQNLANSVWAYATAGESNPALFKKVADHIIALDSLHSFAPQNLANTVWAFAKAKESNPILFDKVANHILSLDNLDSFISKDCAQLLGAYADANIIHIPLFMKVADHAMHSIDFSDLDKGDQHSLLAAFVKAENARKESEGTNDDDSSESPPKSD